jgi:short-subunit dehydrogenase
MKLEGKYILLTGATGGIGQQIAHALVAKGANLLLSARELSKLESLRKSLCRPNDHQCISADLTKQDGITTLQEYCQQQVQNEQRIDVVINNAGCNQFSFLAQRSSQSIEQELHINLLVPILLSQSAIAWLNRPGIIVNMGSTFGSIGFPGYSSYCAAKSGVQRFSESLDRELDGAGIRVLYLAPRTTNTELNNPIVKQMNQQLGNHSDEPKVVAQHLIKVLEKELSAHWIGWPEKLFARINQIFPTLVSHAIRKQQSVIHQFINQVQGKS